MLLNAARRFAVILVATSVGTAAASLAIGLLIGSSVSRSLSVGFYIVGAFLLIFGFFVGNRGPVRVKGDPGFDVLVPFRVAKGDDGAADLAAVRAGLEELAALGVTDVLVHVRALQSFAEAEAAFGDLVETLSAATG